ncbi:uncharacterized protein LOC131006301 [Salvia miltiorrhiza]|uniref:uncharacterized protein LOC131006301 n=1 Tax=Salvia miltiorrhiza TaxID=226208 RepID=UPI0025ACEC26|nr:uncharacterized protein LOC131006301 [Salvia miltiorrhiza]
MKLASYNIRGLGSKIKKREIRELIQKQMIDLCLIQETKMENFSDSDLRSIWGSEKFDFARKQAEGRLGGIISIWNPMIFSSLSQWDIPGALIVNGKWMSNNLLGCIINVYAFQILSDRELLWDSLGMVIRQNCDSCICIAGDFNTIRYDFERVGRGLQFSYRDILAFDNFIRANDLVEIRLQGRNFTWYQPNGQCKTKLNRFLVNEKWLEVWPHSKANGLQWSISDHCPILLETKWVDWGPKPFCFLNAWTSHKDFEKVVKESWDRSGIFGWKSFVFKEKLKKLKGDLKKWNSSTFGLIEVNIKNLKDEIQTWDAIDDSFGLEEGELIKRNKAATNLILQLKNRDSILSQKSRARWLADGDVNSIFFHKVIKGRRLKNEISGLWNNNRWIDDPTEVKNMVKAFFQAQFQSSPRVRPLLPKNFVQKKIPDNYREWLDSPFHRGGD